MKHDPLYCLLVVREIEFSGDPWTLVIRGYSDDSAEKTDREVGNFLALFEHSMNTASEIEEALDHASSQEETSYTVAVLVPGHGALARAQGEHAIARYEMAVTTRNLLDLQRANERDRIRAEFSVGDDIDLSTLIDGPEEAQ